MNGLEVVVVAVLFLLGYWIVGALWDKVHRKAATDPGNEQAAGAELRADQVAAEASWHEVLKVSPDASVEQIKSAYRVEIGRYHPDKLAEMGPEFQEIANRMSQRINRAYDAALESKRAS